MILRNSNAADDLKILQIKVEEKQQEIQRLKEKSIQDEGGNRELQKNYSNVLKERDNLFQRYKT